MIRIVAALVFVFASLTAQAQIQNEPTEIITAAPPATFSERSGLWPTETLPEDLFTNDKSTLNDRWNTIPGVQARESGSPTISIRGSALANRVLKLFDGAPLNMADGVGANDLLIPTEVMSQVALIKGPASVFYGTSAMAGAIDHRLRYFDRPTIDVNIADAGGEIGDRRATLIVPFTNKDHKPVAQVSLLSERDPGNFLYQSTSSAANGRRDFNSKDLQRVTAATDLSLGGGWSLAARAVEAQSQGESPGPTYSPLISRYKFTGSLVTAEAKHATATTTASLRLTDSRLWGLYDESAPSQSTSFTSRTSLFADFNTVVTDSLLLRSFADVSMNQLTAGFVGNSKYFLTDTDVGQTLQISLSPEFSLQPAYRYQTLYGQWFKALAAIWSQNKFVTSLKYSEGFSAPSLTDKYATFYTYLANPSLQPERSWSTELGTSFEQGHRYGGFLDGLGAKASVYFTKYTDLIDTRSVGTNITKVNTGEAQSAGAETSIAYGYHVWMTSFGYNYLDSKNTTTNEPLRLSPRHQGVVTVAQLIGPILIEAKETLWSSFFERDQNQKLVELPAWQTFDLTFRTLALTDWEFRGGVLNLFDQARELTYGYPEPQRRFFVSGTRSF